MVTKKQAPLKITPPFGYGEVAVLKKADRVPLPAPDAMPDFCRTTNALAISLSEFPIAARDYPIVFASGSSKPDSAVIVLGLADRLSASIELHLLGSARRRRSDRTACYDVSSA